MIDSKKSRNLEVGLVQINNSFSDQIYLPYSVGLLESYVKANASKPDQFHFVEPIYKRIMVDEVVDRLVGVDVVGFSTYVWNIKISLESARFIKQEKPETVVVFGGPQMPDKAEQFLRENPFIDFIVHNEGEAVFLQLLEDISSNKKFDEIPSLSYLDLKGQFYRTDNAPRIRELEKIPSPFLDGTFEVLMDAHPEETWIGLWETNRGCPFACTFCDWGSATVSKVNQFDMERLQKEVEWFAANSIEFLFCCDANFGILKRDVDIASYVAQIKQATGYPKALSIQNTKNATERAYLTQKILSDAGLNKGVTLSMQSLDDNTLNAIKRENIRISTYMELQRRFTQDKVETYSDLILGLPGESYESFADGVESLIENGQHNRIQFNNLSILPNAEMGDPEYQKRYGMVSVETEIVNMHGQREIAKDGIVETQQLVIATESMPKEDWRRARAFAWMTALVYFDKLFQIPIILTRQIYGTRFRHILDTLMEAEATTYPIISDIRDFFISEAARIQDGGVEYTFSQEWLSIYWPCDEYVFIQLTIENKIDKLFSEMTALLKDLITKESINVPYKVINDAMNLNRALIKQPMEKKNISVHASFDVMDYYYKVIDGIDCDLQWVPTTYNIDRSNETWEIFQDWCQEVVWYGNKKGAYLYGNKAVEKDLAGHH